MDATNPVQRVAIRIDAGGEDGRGQGRSNKTHLSGVNSEEWLTSLSALAKERIRERNDPCVEVSDCSMFE